MTRFILCAALFLSACTAVRLEEREFAHADGGTARYFAIEKGFTAVSDPDSYFFVIPGSDCVALKQWLPQYFDGLGDRSGSLRIFVIQKRGIREPSSNPLECSEEFTRFDHPRRWIADYSAFIRSKMADARAPKRVVLVGVSEGAEVVPHLATHIPQVTHVALLGSAGIDPYEAFAIQAKRRGFERAAEVFALAAGPAPVDADAPRSELAGRSWRYWAELGELQPMAHLMALEIPILVAMGARDASMPPEGLQRLERAFRARGKTNLEVRLYPDADHGLYDARHRINLLPDFWRSVDDWSAR